MTLFGSRSQDFTICMHLKGKMMMCNIRLTHFILPAREQIWVPWADCKASHSRNMSGQGQLELAASQIPYFHDSITSASREPLVPRLHRNTPNPSKMSGNDAH